MSTKSSGGNMDAFLRFSLGWYNTDDLNLHIIEPDGNEIFYNNKQFNISGFLDVDMNVRGETKEPVENIVYTNKNEIIFKIKESFNRLIKVII
jgi:uncharacterized protein YfaP (DUF2135 family)